MDIRILQTSPSVQVPCRHFDQPLAVSAAAPESCHKNSTQRLRVSGFRPDPCLLAEVTLGANEYRIEHDDPCPARSELTFERTRDLASRLRL
jgi:hypothetical protein